MKCALLGALVCAVGFVACSDDDDVVGSSPTAPDTDFTPFVISDEEQAMITEKLAMITEYYAEKEPDHFLILIGNKDTLVDDMSCSSHDKAVVEQMLSGGNPRFLHLAPKEAIAEGALNQKYADAPDNIKEAIDYVNQFSSRRDAFAGEAEKGRILFNATVREERSRINGECLDLGVHHLGLFRDTEVVTEMNNAGYGVATWNGLPVYASYNCNSNWEHSHKNAAGCASCYRCIGAWLQVENLGGIGGYEKKVYYWGEVRSGGINCNDADRSEIRNESQCDFDPDTYGE